MIELERRIRNKKTKQPVKGVEKIHGDANKGKWCSTSTEANLKFEN